MDLLSKEEILVNKERYFELVKEGNIFVYPTDTIYGIGCSAVDQEAVEEVRRIKRKYKPFSILIPSVDWIYNNCKVNEAAEKWIGKLPGPYTLILELENNKAVVESVNSGSNKIGVRLPDHWFTGFVRELELPILTTAANVEGGNFMTEIDDIHPRIKESVRFAVYEGPIRGSPSTLVDLSKDEIELTER